jgi:hypothetical protein
MIERKKRELTWWLGWGREKMKTRRRNVGFLNFKQRVLMPGSRGLREKMVKRQAIAKGHFKSHPNNNLGA